MIDDVFGKVCVPIFMEKYKNRRGDVIVEGCCFLFASLLELSRLRECFFV